MTPCPSCAGTGRWLIEDTDELRDCVTCGGSGEADARPWIGPGETPHEYYPDLMAMGDCLICGHVQEAHRDHKEDKA